MMRNNGSLDVRLQREPPNSMFVRRGAQIKLKKKKLFTDFR